jgi:hypothetical protein
MFCEVYSIHDRTVYWQFARARVLSTMYGAAVATLRGNKHFGPTTRKEKAYFVYNLDLSVLPESYYWPRSRKQVPEEVMAVIPPEDRACLIMKWNFGEIGLIHQYLFVKDLLKQYDLHSEEMENKYYNEPIQDEVDAEKKCSEIK